LLSKTKGPINLLPSKPHHTFTENLFWNLVTLVSCGLSWDHVREFRELFVPSRVKDASSVNKMMLNLLTPNVNYSGHTTPLTSKVAFYIFIQQIYVLNILNIVYTLRFFFFKLQFVSSF